MLCQAASWTGSIANQNRGTLGGNIANASPAADSLPVLLIYEARLILVSHRGNSHRRLQRLPHRLQAIASWVTRTNSFKPSNFRFHGLRAKEYIRKVGTRRAQAISKICFAGLKQDNEVRIAIGSVAPTPIRCPDRAGHTEQNRISRPFYPK